MISNKDLSIVIPCKNEKFNIIRVLDSLYNQRNIYNIDVIIADSSDDIETKKILNNIGNKYENKLNIKVIEGGYPSKARFLGSVITNSSYILFLDCDIYFNSNNVIRDTFYYLLYKNKSLLTLKFTTEDKYKIVYNIFNIFQYIGTKLNTCFAVGGFQLWRSFDYWKVGGYDSDLLFAEDFWISSKIKSNKFIIYNKHKVFTNSRRFKQKGIWYMIKLFLLSYLNKNNIDFFKKSHNYWK